MTGQEKSKPNALDTAAEVELTAAEVRAARQALRAGKAAASKANVGARKSDPIGRQADRRKNAFGIAASASKATAVSRAIVSRARGGRKR